MQMLLAAGAPLEGPLGSPSPVALCIERGSLEMVKALVRKGGAALLRLGTYDAGFSALALANKAADTKPPSIEPDPLVEYLLAQPIALSALGFSVSPKEPLAEAMSTACALGLHHVVGALLVRGVSPAPVHPDGRVSLHDAVAGGHVKTVQLLLNAKVDPNVCAVNQAPGLQLALCVAVKLAHIPTARFMIWVLRNKGAEVDLAESDGITTPLQIVKSMRGEATALINDLEASNVSLPLPVGWSEAFDSKLRKPYFFHAKTRATCWDPPLPDGSFTTV